MKSQHSKRALQREVGVRALKAIDASHVATSRVAYPEARAAIARRQSEGSFSPAAGLRMVAALDKDFSALIVIELVAGVARAAGDLAARHTIRDFAAIHIASALECSRLLGVSPTFLSFDRRQAGAAHQEGLRVPDSSKPSNDDASV